MSTCSCLLAFELVSIIGKNVIPTKLVSCLKFHATLHSVCLMNFEYGFCALDCILKVWIWPTVVTYSIGSYLGTGDALHSLRSNLIDPNNVLQSWDPTLVNPCTWFHVTCNNDNSVIRV